MKKDEGAFPHLVLDLILIAALIAISLPVAAAQLMFAPKMLKAGEVQSNRNLQFR